MSSVEASLVSRLFGAPAPPESMPPMSSEQVLKAKVLNDCSGIEAGQFVSFRIIEKLGEGGMGLIFRAQQVYPKRIIALKVMKAAAAEPRNIQRFVREIEILAALQHPSIAQLYSVGEVEAGPSGSLPFLAMELIEGLPITQAAQLQSLDLRGKIELMARVCDAVAYAHARGVIHRDLKPSNILVTHTGHPKIVDFGLAIFVQPNGLPAVSITEAGDLLGTLEYMSPEQAIGSRNAVDHRTDIYALGVVLFEVLTSRRPFNRTDCTLIEALQRARDAEPAKLASESKIYRGDLDIIAAKAMATDRELRYGTASEMAEDLRRYLNSEPIRARRPTWSYRVGKFVARHRLLVVSVSAIIAALSVGLASTVRESRRANIEAANARGQAANAAQEAKHAKLQSARKSLAEADGLTITGRIDEARAAYNEAWSLFEGLGLPTLPAEMGIWQLDVRFGRPIRILEQKTGEVKYSSISANEQHLALGYWQRVQVRSLVGNKVEWDHSFPGEITAMRYSSSGSKLFIAYKDGCEIWDTETKTRIAERKAVNGFQLIDLNDRVIAASDRNRHVFFSEFSTFSQTPAINLPDSPYDCAAIVDDRTVNLIFNRSQAYTISDGELKRVGTLPEDPKPYSVMMARDGKHLLALGGKGTLYRFDDLQALHQFETTPRDRIAFFDNQTLIFQGYQSNLADLVEFDGTIRGSLPGFNSSLSISHSKHFAIAPGSGDSLVLRANRIPSASRVLVESQSKPTIQAALSNGGALAAIAMSDGSVNVYETSSGKLARSLQVGSKPVRLLQFSANSEYLGTGIDGTLEFWNLHTGNRIAKIVEARKLRDFAIAPSGSFCCTVDGEELSVVVHGLEEKADYEERLPGKFSSVFFTKDRDMFVLLGSTNEEVWDLTSGVPQRISSQVPFENAASRGAVDDQGRNIVLAGVRHGIQIWRLPAGFLRPSSHFGDQFNNWFLSEDLIVLVNHTDLSVLDLNADELCGRIVWPKDIGEPLLRKTAEGKMLASSSRGLLVNNWHLPRKLRSLESGPGIADQWFWDAGFYPANLASDGSQ